MFSHVRVLFNSEAGKKNKAGLNIFFIIAKICLSGYLRIHMASWVAQDTQERSGKKMVVNPPNLQRIQN